MATPKSQMGRIDAQHKRLESATAHWQTQMEAALKSLQVQLEKMIEVLYRDMAKALERKPDTFRLTFPWEKLARKCKESPTLYCAYSTIDGEPNDICLICGRPEKPAPKGQDK